MFALCGRKGNPTQLDLAPRGASSEIESMVKIDFEAIRKLSVPDRVKLMHDIWDTLQPTAEQLPLTPAQRQLLDERLAAHEADPESAISLQELRANLGLP